MHIERIILTNFQCFGPEPETIHLEDGITAFIGANGSGKTAVCQALQRVFGMSSEDRAIRVTDFHVPADEAKPPDERALRIEVVLGFPELAGDYDGDTSAVPEFFARMAATENEQLKCRIVLRAVWVPDGTAEGAIDDPREVVRTFDPEYTPENCSPLPSALRSRIQMLYIPASRDGARHAVNFLRGRLWRSAQWTSTFSDHMEAASAELLEQFQLEPVTRDVQSALTTRWQQLHDTGIHSEPQFRPLARDIGHLLRNTELVFQPGHDGQARPARMLSDGQRSLLHLAITAATLDLEAKVAGDESATTFGLAAGKLPNLTLIAVEEPENSLSPYHLSRITQQLQGLCDRGRTQVVFATHSPSVLSRIEPEFIRYFRLDPCTTTASVRPITLPDTEDDAEKYVREALLAHPELYFAKFVVLGEGDSERIVIPKIAKARGIDLDPSFVAVVPLGGRHSNHFWRLFHDLDIPHATLLDLDRGRAGGDSGRLRDACAWLQEFDIDVLTDLDDPITSEQRADVVDQLRQHGVFFSAPLDLDHTMLTTYWDAYAHIDANGRGPETTDATKTVLGAGTHDGYWAPDDPNLASRRQDELRWYRYLFLSRSKPGTHTRALARLTPEELAVGPGVISDLIDHIASTIYRRVDQ